MGIADVVAVLVDWTSYDRRSWQWRRHYGSTPPTPLDQLRLQLALSEVS